MRAARAEPHTIKALCLQCVFGHSGRGVSRDKTVRHVEVGGAHTLDLHIDAGAHLLR